MNNFVSRWLAGYLARAVAPVVARRAPDFEVLNAQDQPYLQRWWLIPRNKVFNIYLHRFLSSDDDRALHDHPWPSVSIALGALDRDVFDRSAALIEVFKSRGGEMVRTIPFGPWSATDTNPETRGGLFGTGLSVGSAGQLIARGWGEAQQMVEGGATPTEVRDRVETVTKNLAAVMKPLIRAPGEGAWSDKDQANLEAQIGMLTRSRTVEEYNRRLADIQENVSKVFKLNVPAPGTVTRRADAPMPAEEEMTAIERLFGKQLK